MIKYLKIMAVLAFLCAGVMACETVQKSHEASAIPLRDPRLLMDYDSIGEGLVKKGNVLMQITLVGQSKTLLPGEPAPSPPPPPQANAAPEIPKEMPRDLKDAKLRWVPPQKPMRSPAPPPPPARSPQRPQPYVLATANHGGLTGAVEITKATLNLLAQAGLSYFAPGTKINMNQQGARAFANAVNSNKINQQQWSELTAVQQTEVINNLTTSSSAGSSSVANTGGKKK